MSHPRNPARLPLILGLAAAVAGTALLLNSGCGGKGGTDAAGGTAYAGLRLTGGGATFPEPVVQEWTGMFQEKTGLEIDYQGTGSGNGIQQMIARTIDFGCSDAPMNQEQFATAREAGGDVIHIPIVIGAVVPAYHLDGVPSDKPLNFSGPVLADIYLGKVKKWNDPKLKELNPGVNLPDLDIAPVYRSDSSGTTAIFTEYLSKVSDEFKATVGSSTSPRWPAGLGSGQPKTAGVASHVARSNGAIGYIELTYALDTKIAYGTVKNQAGKQVLASLESASAAADASLGKKQEAEPYSLHDLAYSLTNAEGEGSYPISGMSYALLFKKQSGQKGKALVDFLKWATTEGQAKAKERNYAPLPAGLQKGIADKLAAVELAP